MPRSGREAAMAGCFILASIIVFCAAPGVSRAELIDRIEAAVNNDVITLSELRQAVSFNTALGGKGNGRRLQAETLEGLINRRLLLQEAYRLKFVEVSDQEAAGEVSRLKQRLGADAAFRDFLARTGLTEKQLARMLKERLLVERFVERKIGLFARVSRDEAESYFREHSEEFKGRRFAEVQKAVSALLSAQKVSQQLDQYVAELRSRADIRINPAGEEG